MDTNFGVRRSPSGPGQQTAPCTFSGVARRIRKITPVQAFERSGLTVRGIRKALTGERASEWTQTNRIGALVVSRFPARFVELGVVEAAQRAFSELGMSLDDLREASSLERNTIPEHLGKLLIREGTIARAELNLILRLSTVVDVESEAIDGWLREHFGPVRQLREDRARLAATLLAQAAPNLRGSVRRRASEISTVLRGQEHATQVP